MSEHNIIEDATKWRKLIGWIKKTADEEDTDIWEFLEDELGVSSTGIEQCTEKDELVMFDCAQYPSGIIILDDSGGWIDPDNYYVD